MQQKAKERREEAKGAAMNALLNAYDDKIAYADSNPAPLPRRKKQAFYKCRKCLYVHSLIHSLLIHSFIGASPLRALVLNLLYVCVVDRVSGLAEVSIEVAIIEGQPSLVRATLARLAKHRPHEINQYYVSGTHMPLPHRHMPTLHRG